MDSAGMSSRNLIGDLSQATHHGGTDAARLARGLLPSNLGNGGLTILDNNDSSLGVDLEEALSGSSVFVDFTDSQKLDDQKLSSLNLDVHLLVDDGLAQEVTSRDNAVVVKSQILHAFTALVRTSLPQVAVFLNESLILLKDLIRRGN